MSRPIEIANYSRGLPSDESTHPTAAPNDVEGGFNAKTPHARFPPYGE
jgi:hypothetical protein